ncbi:MAG TPA: ATP-binding protein [Caulobacteraceae bacterium]|nr:ATP-binding protein [Caulobacteraceae bacterium]
MRGLLRSSSLRLAALYGAAFTLAVAALGAITLLTARAALGRVLDQRIASESASLAQEYRTEGLTGVVQAVQERDRTPGALDYGLRGPSGRPMAGRLDGMTAPTGWSVFAGPGRRGEDTERIRVLTTTLPGGYRLLVGDDLERIEALDDALFRRFGAALLAIGLLGVAGGWALARGMSRRIGEITGTAEAIIDGDLSRRVPPAVGGDDLGRLAGAFNRMLDRIQALMESLRQVSNDIAHDLRTPLTRLRGRLEATLAEPVGPAQGAAIEAALADLDAILSTFAALLRIAQIESGARRAGFRTVDLVDIARTVTEAFAPSAEDAGQSLALQVAEPVPIEGDRELLIQMLANLVENSLRHAGQGARVVVSCGEVEGRARLSVADDGPGVPSAERARLFDRFHRLEASRSTPGSGLGLALVAAVARLHGAEATLEDAAPGLEALVVFPRSANIATSQSIGHSLARLERQEARP